MMDIEEIDRQIAGLESVVTPLHSALDLLHTERRKLSAAAWITEHGVTLAEIEDLMDFSQVGTYFSDFKQAGDWLREKETLKRFTHWNGYVYFTSDFLAGRLTPGPAQMRDVKS